MKSKIKNLILVILVIFGIMALMSGCSSSKTSVNIQVVESSVDPIVTNILTSLSNNNYTGFAQNFDQTMKNTINPFYACAIKVLYWPTFFE